MKIITKGVTSGFSEKERIEMASGRLPKRIVKEHAAELAKLREENERLRALVLKGVAVVEDFMPNIRNCVLQDYARLNEFLLESRMGAGVEEQ